MFANSNNVHDGVTIDFGYMNTTTYDPQTNIASIQPGERWGSVYNMLQPFGVSVAGGRQTPVGVAGFLLGGGNSYYNNARGWGCDSVVSFEVVLADGRVVDASATENRDLWIALKGGSGNLGLVTRFDMEAVAYANASDPVFWCGLVSWGVDMSDRVIDVLSAFADDAPGDVRSTSHCLFAYGYAGDSSIICPLVNTDDREWAPAFDGWASIPNRTGSTMRHDTMWSIAEEVSGSGGSQ
ncbi:hypothetical protein KJ359_009317 [Pestalotiopsis sp. 9143b]|nr:hypothetical protein KJ359_009317 [Pestalotiopsis sp. 9143b]